MQKKLWICKKQELNYLKENKNKAGKKIIKKILKKSKKSIDKDKWLMYNKNRSAYLGTKVH